MPLVTLQTNQRVQEEALSKILAEATAVTAAQLGKPESVTMAIAHTEVAMTFGGNSDPAALFEIEGIELANDPAESLCDALCDLAESQLGVPADRVFVKLHSLPRGAWGGNRKIY